MKNNVVLEVDIHMSIIKGLLDNNLSGHNEGVRKQSNYLYGTWPLVALVDACLDWRRWEQFSCPLI